MEANKMYEDVVYLIFNVFKNEKKPYNVKSWSWIWSKNFRIN
jgi:hypothetical protein